MCGCCQDSGGWMGGGENKAWNNELNYDYFLSWILSTNDWLVFSRKLINNFAHPRNKYSCNKFYSSSGRLHWSQERWWFYRSCTTYNHVHLSFELWGPGGCLQTRWIISNWFWDFPESISSQNTSVHGTPLGTTLYGSVGAHGSTTDYWAAVGWQNKKLLAWALDWCRFASSLCPSEQVFITRYEKK